VSTGLFISESINSFDSNQFFEYFNKTLDFLFDGISDDVRNIIPPNVLSIEELAQKNSYDQQIEEPLERAFDMEFLLMTKFISLFEKSFLN
jgi:hypothetical protein